ncbi:YraN family protein [Paenibacillus sp. IB182496]|uniref:UPF0102 protein IDH44_08880 n=1 Tax=Paenibacillus sabuli TaxID=2772509 RepID=A0A927BTM3_9BACL|nr:YraN family protein [Paenibacillus sabuli]MBD2845304.1 YraN family protein [Paenibacillus sabuli]
MSISRAEVGRRGEAEAAAYLIAQGWTVHVRNWRCPAGEIDLIGSPARSGLLVFVEVRSRRAGGRFGTAAESIDGRKQQRVRTAAQWYLKRHGGGEAGVRCDVITVAFDRQLRVAGVSHLEGAF